MFVYQRVMIDTLVKDQAATMFQHDPGHQAAAHELREELEGLKERFWWWSGFKLPVSSKVALKSTKNVSFRLFYHLVI